MCRCACAWLVVITISSSCGVTHHHAGVFVTPGTASAITPASFSARNTPGVERALTAVHAGVRCNGHITCFGTIIIQNGPLDHRSGTEQFLRCHICSGADSSPYVPAQTLQSQRSLPAVSFRSGLKFCPTLSSPNSGAFSGAFEGEFDSTIVIITITTLSCTLLASTATASNVPSYVGSSP